MKTQTPRQWLLERHEIDASQLDGFRHGLLAGISGNPKDSVDRRPGGFRPMLALWIGAGAVAAALVGFIFLRPALPPRALAESVSAPSEPRAEPGPVAVAKESVTVPRNGSKEPVAKPVDLRNLNGPATVVPLPLYPLNPKAGSGLAKEGQSPAAPPIILRKELDALRQKVAAAAAAGAAGSAAVEFSPVTIDGPGSPGGVGESRPGLSMESSNPDTSEGPGRTVTRVMGAQAAGAVPSKDGTPSADSEKGKLDQRLAQTQAALAAAEAQAARVAGTRGLLIVTGQVVKPGTVAVVPATPVSAPSTANLSMPLADAINAAGGLKDGGNGAAITVTRTLADGTTQTFGPLNLGSDQGKNFRVQPADRINVPMRLF